MSSRGRRSLSAQGQNTVAAMLTLDNDTMNLVLEPFPIRDIARLRSVSMALNTRLLELYGQQWFDNTAFVHKMCHDTINALNSRNSANLHNIARLNMHDVARRIHWLLQKDASTATKITELLETTKQAVITAVHHNEAMKYPQVESRASKLQLLDIYFDRIVCSAMMAFIECIVHLNDGAQSREVIIDSINKVVAVCCSLSTEQHTLLPHGYMHYLPLMQSAFKVIDKVSKQTNISMLNLLKESDPYISLLENAPERAGDLVHSIPNSGILLRG